MTKIRLTRLGRKHVPYYHIVVCDARKKRDGKYIEKIGTYDPLHKINNNIRCSIDIIRYKYWISVGAVPTDIVKKLFKEYDS